MSSRDWFQHMEARDAPVFRQTALEVSEIAADPESGAERLSLLILRDPLLAGTVLRMANTAFYNPSGREVQTVAKAVFLLGLERIRTLCMSAMLVETLRTGRALGRVRRELGRSIHAAVLARAIGQERREPAIDEVFLAGLLLRVGPLLFWSLGGSDADALDRALAGTIEDESVETAVAGFPLSELTLHAALGWKLSRLLVDVLRGGEANIPMACVDAAWTFIRGIGEPDGCSTVELLERTAVIAAIEPCRMAELVAAAAGEARSWALEMGAGEVVSAIPDPSG